MGESKLPHRRATNGIDRGARRNHGETGLAMSALGVRAPHGGTRLAMSGASFLSPPGETKMSDACPDYTVQGTCARVEALVGGRAIPPALAQLLHEQCCSDCRVSRYCTTTRPRQTRSVTEQGSIKEEKLETKRLRTTRRSRSWAGSMSSPLPKRVHPDMGLSLGADTAPLKCPPLWRRLFVLMSGHSRP